MSENQWKHRHRRNEGEQMTNTKKTNKKPNKNQIKEEKRKKERENKV